MLLFRSSAFICGFVIIDEQGEWLSRITKKNPVFFQIKKARLALFYYLFFIQYNLSAVWFLLYGDFLRTTLGDPFYMDFHPDILRSILCGVQNRSGWRISSNKRLPHDDRVNVCLDHFWKKSTYSGWKLASKYKFWFFQLSFLGFFYSILNQ